MTEKETSNIWSSPPPVLILGVGSILLRDEGVGVRLVEAMSKRKLPPGVELIDGGTASVELIDYIRGRKKVVIVDAVKGGQEPATIYRFKDTDVDGVERPQLSLHDIGLLENLALVKYLDKPPEEMIIFGVEPKDLSVGLELSPEVARVIPRLIELVIAEIAKN
ncbi:MAG: HyaD/HybD family hydrogenase maturation endopeptidase [Dehalococcoidales bacterium]